MDYRCFQNIAFSNTKETTKTQPPLTKPISCSIQAHSELYKANLEGVEILAALGLTSRQARAYLSLLKAGNARVQTIAEPSLIHRQEIYRVLDSLMQKGLVQRNISAPTTYTPAPIEEAIQMLLHQRTNQLKIISKQAEELTKKLSQNKTKIVAVDLKPCFGVVFEADRGRKYHKALETARSSVLAVMSWKRFRQLSIFFQDEIQSSLENGIVIRLATEKPKNHRFPKWIKLALEKYRQFELKTTTAAPSAGVTIFDHTQAAIAFNPNSSLTRGPDMWTVHPALIETFQSYFNSYWAAIK